MTEAKIPQDHKKKTAKFDISEPFTFTHDGEEYSFASFEDHVTPGFLRKNRRMDEVDLTYTLIEMLADDDTLEVLDAMSFPEHTKFQEDFGDYFQKCMKASLGESSAS